MASAWSCWSANGRRWRLPFITKAHTSAGPNYKNTLFGVSIQSSREKFEAPAVVDESVARVTCTLGAFRLGVDSQLKRNAGSGLIGQAGQKRSARSTTFCRLRCCRECVEIRFRRHLRCDEVIGSSGQVNALRNELLGERLPTIDFAHGDLALRRASAQNNIAAVSADGSTVCVLMRRLNSSWSRSMAFVVRADFHCWCGRPPTASIVPE